MTVAEYIEKLKALPQDAIVASASTGCGCCRENRAYFSQSEPTVMQPGTDPERDWDDDEVKLDDKVAEEPFVVL